jgi:hypothetical protein
VTSPRRRLHVCVATCPTDVLLAVFPPELVGECRLKSTISGVKASISAGTFIGMSGRSSCVSRRMADEAQEDQQPASRQRWLENSRKINHD